MSTFFEKITSPLRRAFLPKLDTGEYAISLDVGTEVVKALLFKNVDGVAHVLGVGRFHQGLADMHAGMVTDIEGVIANCEEAIIEAEEQASVEAIQVSIGIAGELVKGAATVVEHTRAKPNAKIDEKELEQIVKDIQWQAFDQVRKQLALETGYQEIEVKLVNAAIIDVQIDGYRVHNPIGFQGKQLSVSVFNSFAPLVHLGALQSIAEGLGLDLLSIATEPYAVAASVGSDEASEFSGIFIDIGGGTTDVALVRNGGITGTKMFNIGGRTFTKRLAGHFNLAFDRAEQMKLEYTAGSLSRDHSKLVAELLAQDITVWMDGIQLVLEELAASTPLPPRILICGGGSKLPEIRQTLEKYDWPKYLPLAKKPAVSLIQPGDVKRVIDKTGELNSTQDITPMGMASLMLDLMGEEQLVDRLLRQAAKVLQN